MTRTTRHVKGFFLDSFNFIAARQAMKLNDRYRQRGSRAANERVEAEGEQRGQAAAQVKGNAGDAKRVGRAGADRQRGVTQRVCQDEGDIGGGWDDGLVREKVRKETELRIAEALRGGDASVEKLFACLRAGTVKRRELAERLRMSVTEVTNCRKRLNRKLDELEKAGCAGWVLEEWKKK